MICLNVNNPFLNNILQCVQFRILIEFKLKYFWIRKSRANSKLVISSLYWPLHQIYSLGLNCFLWRDLPEHYGSSTLFLFSLFLYKFGTIIVLILSSNKCIFYFHVILPRCTLPAYCHVHQYHETNDTKKINSNIRDCQIIRENNLGAERENKIIDQRGQYLQTCEVLGDAGWRIRPRRTSCRWRWCRLRSGTTCAASWMVNNVHSVWLFASN